MEKKNEEIHQLSKAVKRGESATTIRLNKGKGLHNVSVRQKRRKVKKKYI